MTEGVALRRVRRLDQVGSRVGRWRRDIMSRVVLEPIALVGCVVANIARVKDVELDNETAVLKARRVGFHRGLKGDARKAPFAGVLIVNGVRKEEKLVVTLDDGSNELGLREGIVGIPLQGAAGGGPV